MPHRATLSRIGTNDFLAVMAPGVFIVAVSTFLTTVLLGFNPIKLASLVWTKDGNELTWLTGVAVLLGAYLVGSIPRAIPVKTADAWCKWCFGWLSTEHWYQSLYADKYPYWSALQDTRDAIEDNEKARLPHLDECLPVAKTNGEEPKTHTWINYSKAFVCKESDSLYAVIQAHESATRLFAGMFWAGLFGLFVSGLLVHSLVVGDPKPVLSWWGICAPMLAFCCALTVYSRARNSYSRARNRNKGRFSYKRRFWCMQQKGRSQNVAQGRQVVECTIRWARKVGKRSKWRWTSSPPHWMRRFTACIIRWSLRSPRPPWTWWLTACMIGSVVLLAPLQVLVLSDTHKVFGVVNAAIATLSAAFFFGFGMQLRRVRGREADTVLFSVIVVRNNQKAGMCDSQSLVDSRGNPL